MDLKSFELGDAIIEKHYNEQADIREAIRLEAEQIEAEQERIRQEEPVTLLRAMLEDSLQNGNDDTDMVNMPVGHKKFTRLFELGTARSDEDEQDYELALLVEGSYSPESIYGIARAHEATDKGCTLWLQVTTLGNEPTKHFVSAIGNPSVNGLPSESMGFIGKDEETPARMRMAYAMIREAAALAKHQVLRVPEGYDPAAGWIASQEQAEAQTPQSV